MTLASRTAPTPADPRPANRLSGFGLLAGPVAAFVVWMLCAGLAADARAVAAVAVLMGIFWLTEALPVSATALLPIALLPVLTRGVITIRQITAPYAHEMIFLFLGGFLIALTMQQWRLHRRIALHIILWVGEQPARIVLGFMLASAGLSMWISNTATVVMMLPIALSVVELVRQRFREAADELDSPKLTAEELEPTRFAFAICLLLGTAYAASIGGVATLIGTPPNLMMAAFVSENVGRELSFAGWMPFGLSFAVVLLPITWWILVRVVYPLRIDALPGGRELIRSELRDCGPMSRQERVVMVVFVTTAMLWVLRGTLQKIELGGVAWLSGLSDQGIAIAAAMVLFAWPSRCAPREGPSRLLTWEQARRLPWGILLLFGGGLALASAVRSSRLDQEIGNAIASLRGVPSLLVLLVVATVVIGLTEMTSNAATTATFLPIVAAAAQGLGMDPLVLILPTALAASCAFMMPVATPPNAIVFGSGELTIPQMVRAGIWINLIGLVLIVLWVELLAGPIFGVS